MRRYRSGRARSEEFLRHDVLSGRIQPVLQVSPI
jgi:hypothetical protein